MTNIQITFTCTSAIRLKVFQSDSNCTSYSCDPDSRCLCGKLLCYRITPDLRRAAYAGFVYVCVCSCVFVCVPVCLCGIMCSSPSAFCGLCAERPKRVHILPPHCKYVCIYGLVLVACSIVHLSRLGGAFSRLHTATPRTTFETSTTQSLYTPDGA